MIREYRYIGHVSSYTLRQLEYFAAVAASESVSAAARDSYEPTLQLLLGAQREVLGGEWPALPLAQSHLRSFAEDAGENSNSESMEAMQDFWDSLDDEDKKCLKEICLNDTFGFRFQVETNSFILI